MSRYNIPTLPPPFEIETKAVLKQTAASHRRLAELKGAIKSMPNPSILINTLALQESKDSSEIESIITTHDELYRAQVSSAVRYVSAAAKEVERYNLVRQELLDLPVLYLSRYITHNKGRYYHLLQDVRDNNNWEDWTLFILKGIEETSVATTSLVEQIKALMMNFKHRIREEFPKIYSQDLINNLFRHPYTKIDFVQQELKVSKPTAISYLNQLCECEDPFLQKLKLGRENYYVNNELFNLLQNAFRPNDSK